MPSRCPTTVFMALQGCTHYIQCEVPDDPHPGAPHMARVEATELYTDGFVGWWDTEPPEIPNRDDAPTTETGMTIDPASIRATDEIDGTV